SSRSTSASLSSACAGSPCFSEPSADCALSSAFFRSGRLRGSLRSWMRRARSRISSRSLACWAASSSALARSPALEVRTPALVAAARRLRGRAHRLGRTLQRGRALLRGRRAALRRGLESAPQAVALLRLHGLRAGQGLAEVVELALRLLERLRGLLGRVLRVA